MHPTTAYVPGFEYDIFVSYAHVDNLRRASGKRWVNEFHEQLTNRLAQRVGQMGLVKIWRDVHLDGSQTFDRVIENRIERCAIFIAVTSRGYLKSTYCNKELETFCQSARRSTFGLDIGERRRLLNVQITNLPRSSLPAELPLALGFTFHDAAPQDDLRRLAEPLGVETEEFDAVLRGLADAIYHLLEDFRRGQRPSDASVQRDRYVYLADTADTLSELRGRLASDFRQKGRAVVTDIPPPYDATSHEHQVKLAVEGAALSIHLFDGFAGRSIQGGAPSTYPRRQVEVALATSTPQLVWVPPLDSVGEVQSEEHNAFLDSLERGRRRKANYEFVRAPQARLLPVILDKLKTLESRQTEASHRSSSKAVLLDTHLKDQRIAWELGAYLVSRGLQPFIHPESDDPNAGIRAFEDQLAQVEALVVFFGHVTSEWVEQRLKCALQLVARQLARDLPPMLSDCYVYVLPPTKQALRLAPHIFRVHVLDNSQTNGFDPKAAAPLLAALGSEPAS